MINSNHFIIINLIAFILCLLAAIACACAIYISYKARSEDERRLGLMRAAAAEIERARGEEAAAKRQTSEMKAEFEQLRNLTVDLKRKLDSAKAQQQEKPEPESPIPLVPRTLSADGRRKIVAFLKAYANRMSLTVAMLDEPEPINYGMQVVDALTAAGVRVFVSQVHPSSITNLSDKVLHGIHYAAGCPGPVRMSLENAGLTLTSSLVMPNRADLYIGANSGKL